MKKFLALLFLLPSLVFAETGGDLNLTNKASLISRSGHDLVLGTEGEDDFKIIQNGVTTFSIDGATGVVNIPNSSFTSPLLITGGGSLRIPAATSFSLESGDINSYATIFQISSSGDLAIVGGVNYLGNAVVNSSLSPFVWKLANDSQRVIQFYGSADDALYFSFGDGLFNGAFYSISTMTSDGDDDQALCITGSGNGGCGFDNRGSWLQFEGNEYGGRVLIDTGDASGADITFKTADDFFIKTLGGTTLLTVTELGVTTSASDLVSTAGDIIASTSGKTLMLQEATAGAKCMGSLTCNGASDVVTSTTCAKTASRIFLTRTSLDADTTGDYYVKSISNNTSFTVACETNDTGTLNWFIINEAP